MRFIHSNQIPIKCRLISCILIIAMEKRCLVVPGTFIPFNETITQLVYKQLRLLPLKYDVCALFDKADPKLQEYLLNDPNYVKFHVSYVMNDNDVRFSIHNINLFKGLHNMKKYINAAISMYDGHEYLYTSSFPCYSIRVGVELKKQNPQMKWIANFSDPINHSPYKYDQETYQSYSFPEKIAYKLYCKYYVVDQDEIDAFEKADLLVFICEEQRDFMIQQYLKYAGNISEETILNKCIIVPLNYVPEWNDMTPVKKEMKSDSYTLSHFGRVYGLRLIKEFIYGLQIFISENPNVKLKIIQYGVFRKSDRKLIHKLKLDSFFEIHEKVSYSRCIDKMRDSDWVLLFDTILPEKEIQPYLPSKLVEYSLLQKDVLAVTVNTSPTYRIMKKTDAIVCAYDRYAVAKGLKNMIIDHMPSKVEYRYTNEDAVEILKNRIEKL